MKVSELTEEQVALLDDAQKEQIIFDLAPDDGGKGEFALLLGGNPKFLRERCQAAAELYLDGRVSYVVPSGGVEWELPDGKCSEAEYMKGLLLEMGVPEEGILLENCATTTKENMLYATILMNRVLGLHGLHRAYVVTSQSHMRRSIRYARLLFPRTLEAVPYAAKTGADIKGEWYKTEDGRMRAERELKWIKVEIDRGTLEDIEI